jgi:tetratricopeptide (TPR) repeat protein
VNSDPLNPVLQAELGNMYALLGWDDLAEASYLEAVSIDQNLYEAWTNLGTVYSRQEKLGPAERSFRRAISLQPRAALAYYNLGTVLDRGGRYDEALQAYKVAVTYEPELLDPAINPQVVNNSHLTAIKLLSYLEDAGSGSLPLETFSAEDMDAAVAAATQASGESAALDAPEPQIDPLSGKVILGSLELRKETRSERKERKRREEEAAAAAAAEAEPAPAS